MSIISCVHTRNTQRCLWIHGRWHRHNQSIPQTINAHTHTHTSSQLPPSKKVDIVSSHICTSGSLRYVEPGPKSRATQTHSWEKKIIIENDDTHRALPTGVQRWPTAPNEEHMHQQQMHQERMQIGNPEKGYPCRR